MFQRHKQKSIIISLIVSAVLLVLATVLILKVVHHGEEEQMERVAAYREMGLLKEDEEFMFDDTIPKIPDTSWIGTDSATEEQGQSDSQTAAGDTNKGIVNAESDTNTMRTETKPDLAEDDAIAITDSVNYMPGTYVELSD